MISFSLESIAQRILTQDNRCTAHPIFEVEEQKRIYGMDTSNDCEIAWLYGDDYTELPEAQTKIAENFYQENRTGPRFIAGTQAFGNMRKRPDDDDIEVYGSLRRIGYIERWEYVQPFFTEAGAQRYIEENGHNHRGKLRIFAGAAFRNWEWQALREFLCSQGAGPRAAAGKSESDGVERLGRLK